MSKTNERNVIELIISTYDLDDSAPENHKQLYYLHPKNKIFIQKGEFDTTPKEEIYQIILKLFLGILSIEYGKQYDLMNVSTQENIATAIFCISGMKFAQSSISDAFNKHLNKSKYIYDSKLYYIKKVKTTDGFQFKLFTDSTYQSFALTRLQDLLIFRPSNIWINNPQYPTMFSFIVNKDNVENVLDCMNTLFWEIFFIDSTELDTNRSVIAMQISHYNNTALKQAKKLMKFLDEKMM